MPSASGLEAQIRSEFPDAEVELIRSSGGVFEVSRDGVLIFSKKRTGKRPTWQDIQPHLL